MTEYFTVRESITKPDINVFCLEGCQSGYRGYFIARPYVRVL